MHIHVAWFRYLLPFRSSLPSMICQCEFRANANLESRRLPLHSFLVFIIPANHQGLISFKHLCRVSVRLDERVCTQPVAFSQGWFRSRGSPGISVGFICCQLCLDAAYSHIIQNDQQYQWLFKHRPGDAIALLADNAYTWMNTKLGSWIARFDRLTYSRTSSAASPCPN